MQEQENPVRGTVPDDEVNSASLQDVELAEVAKDEPAKNDAAPPAEDEISCCNYGSSYRQSYRKYMVEFVGTMLFCMIISYVVYAKQTKQTSSMPVEMVIGCALMVVVYMCAGTSGGHVNPAVSLAVFLTSNTIHSSRKHVDFNLLNLAGYWLAQVAGSLIGGAIVRFNMEERCQTPLVNGTCTFYADTGFPARGMQSFPSGVDEISHGSALGVEIMGTMSLCLVVLNVATNRSNAANAGNSTFGIAIGFTVVSWAIAGGSISGGAFNPAVGMLSAVHEKTNDLWVHWLGPLIGALFASLVYYGTNPGEFVAGTINPMWKSAKDALNEFIGTMLFCLVISLAAGNNENWAGLGIGSMLMCMVYMGGHISGGHYNPAVTFAVTLRRKCPVGTAAAYVAAQVAGAMVGGAIAYGIAESTTAHNPDGSAAACQQGNVVCYGFPRFGKSQWMADYGEEHSFAHALLAELIGTFILCFSVLNSATCTKQNANNSYYGIAIGFSVFICAYSLGSISGGAFNPAVGMLAALASKDTNKGLVDDNRNWKWVGCYWLGPLLGALLATGFFWLVNPDEIADINSSKVVKHGEHGNVEQKHQEGSNKGSSDLGGRDDLGGSIQAIDLASNLQAPAE